MIAGNHDFFAAQCRNQHIFQCFLRTRGNIGFTCGEVEFHCAVCSNDAGFVLRFVCRTLVLYDAFVNRDREVFVADRFGRGEFDFELRCFLDNE